MGWIHNRFHNRLVKVVFELVSTALVYWFLGPVVFLYAALMIGDTLKNAQQKDSILSGIGYSVCILVLTIAWILLSTQTLQYQCTASLPDSIIIVIRVSYLRCLLL